MKKKLVQRSAQEVVAGLFLLFFASGANVAAGEELITGPPEGTELTPVRCYANSGAFAGREEFDAAKEIGDGPGALLFVHVLNRNTAPLIRGLDNFNSEYGLFGFKSFVIQLVSDRTAGEEELARVNGSLKLGNPMVLSLDGLDGPGNYALNRKCTLSLVLMNDRKALQSVAYVDTGMADLPVIREMIEGVIGEVPEDDAALRRIAGKNLPADENALRDLAARQAAELHRFYHEKAVEFETGPRYPANQRNAMRGGAQAMPQAGQGRMEEPRGGGGGAPQTGEKPPAAQKVPSPGGPADRVGKAPEDPELSSLLRAFIRQTNDDATTDQVFGDITARGAQSADLGGQTVEMFRLMLSFPDRYGTAHAQELAREFLENHVASGTSGRKE